MRPVVRNSHLNSIEWQGRAMRDDILLWLIFIAVLAVLVLQIVHIYN